MIDATVLRSLITLQSAGTVAATADLLGYTPSAISQQLRRLERDVGVQLTERVGRGVVLTVAGRHFAERGRDLIDSMERITSELSDKAACLRGEVRLATFSTAERGIVASALSSLRASAPEVSITVLEGDPPDAALALERGQVDLALLHSWVGLPAHLPPQITTDELGSDVADLVVPATHRLAERRHVEPGDLVDETWACVHTGSVCHQWIVQMFTGLDRAPQVQYWSSEFASQIAYVDAGIAVALVPRLGRGPLPAGVRAIEVKNPLPRRPVLLARRQARVDDPVLRHVSVALQDAAHRALTP